MRRFSRTRDRRQLKRYPFLEKYTRARKIELPIDFPQRHFNLENRSCNARVARGMSVPHTSGGLLSSSSARLLLCMPRGTRALQEFAPDFFSDESHSVLGAFRIIPFP
jgi:hypothetical protein